jgi:hypothetical protein
MEGLADTSKWIRSFIMETQGLAVADCRAHAFELMGLLSKYLSASGDPMTQEDCCTIFWHRDEFEKAFERERRNLDVFVVEPKGIYDTRKLIESPEEKYPDRLRKAFTPEILKDLQQAGRCLAFDCPTACAFHIFRATESLMLSYYEFLAGQPWSLPKNKDWNAYINHLRLKGAPDNIAARLDEIRLLERNPYLHPEKTVSLEEAPVQFELCTGVIFYMTQEMTR